MDIDVTIYNLFFYQCNQDVERGKYKFYKRIATKDDLVKYTHKVWIR